MFTDILKEKEPKFYFYKFWKSLFGQFKDSVIKAIEQDKAAYKFETDITGFFDSIPHYNLLFTLGTKFGVEDEILDILSGCLNAWSGTKESNTPGIGIPQGPLPSYLLANLILYQLDEKLINEAFKYYRYMDDINIYGYSETDLRNVMVTIDNYLKGNGLSINSKKTGIKIIDPEKEDATVKELRRFEVVTSDYDGQEVIISGVVENDLSHDIIKSLIHLGDQSQEEPNALNHFTIIDYITDEKEIVKFWEKQIKEVEQELPRLFKKDIVELRDPEKTDDVDFIRLSAKYGTALHAIKNFKEVKAADHLLPYWLFALKKYFWRVKNYVLTLNHYKDHVGLKKELLALHDLEKNYEHYRYHTIICLTYNFSFTNKELIDIFKILKSENSELVRYALYCLIIKHTKDPQLLSSLKGHLASESGNYLKLITLNYWKKQKPQTMDELVKQIGL
jgi:hypothetical protein